MLSIISQTGYVTADSIKDKSAPELLRALKKQMAFFAMYSKKVKLIISDSESGLVAIKSDLDPDLTNLPRGVKPA